ncbi:hypothetical protein H2203_004824 [Taxawa tesnikishii (nom. ined.)]|nr:hypothetical protein H2203_004824 [Dothideales sp. JES 119]
MSRERDTTQSLVRLVQTNKPTAGEDAHLALLMSMATGLYLGAKEIHAGKEPFEWLRYEANVTGDSKRGKRLVDDAFYAQNQALWIQLLYYRRRLDGLKGVRDIWTGMKTRGVALPTEGEAADMFWQTFAAMGVGDSELLEEVYTHAKKQFRSSGMYYAELYKCIIGPLFREKPTTVNRWHKRFEADGMLPSDALRSVAHDAVLAPRIGKARNVFRELYGSSKERDLYDHYMYVLMEHARFEDMVKWHKVFVRKNDLPSPELRTNQTIQRLFRFSDPRNARELKLFGKDSSLRRDSRTPGSVSPDPPLWSRESMNRIVGDVHGFKQKEISDQFCARLFATSTFSVGTVVNGLQLFGLEEIGPLALREIAARSQTVLEFNAAIRALKAALIKIPKSTFTQALLKFASEKQQQYFDFLVTSDQHPQSYEDQSLQKKLLASHLEAGDMAKAHATFAILTLSKKDPQEDMWNLLLQTYCKNSSWWHVLQIVHDMQLQRIPISSYSLDVLHRYCLRTRRPGKRPVTKAPGFENFDDMNFVRNVFITVLRSGQDLEPTRWRELMKRYGMTGRLSGLEQLSFWLALWYGKHTRVKYRSLLSGRHKDIDDFQPSNTDAPGWLPPQDVSHPLRQIFHPALQRAMISWGFKSTLLGFDRERESDLSMAISTRNARVRAPFVRYQSWARGVILLQKLKELGVQVPTSLVRKEIVLELWKLYGPLVSRRKSTRLLKTTNDMSLTDRVRHVQNLWGERLFDLPPEALEGDRTSETKLYNIVFGQRRHRTFKQRRRILMQRHRSRDLSATRIVHSGLLQIATQDSTIASRHRADKEQSLEKNSSQTFAGT